MANLRPSSRLVRLAGITGLLGVGWCAGVALLAGTPAGAPAAASQFGANRITAERWLLGPGAGTVIVGTSMSARLPSAGLGPDAANLGMAGIHALDALVIATAQDRAPQRVVIETNFLYWPPNPVFVDGVVHPLRQALMRTVPALRTENQPLNLLVRGLRSRSGEGASAGVDERVREAEVVRQLSELAQPPPAAAWAAALARLDAAVAALRASGTEVCFLEMPMDPRLLAAPRQTMTRAELLRRYPPQRWAWLRLADAADWPTTDGVHLEPAAAGRAAVVIATWLTGYQAQARPARAQN